MNKYVESFETLKELGRDISILFILSGLVGGIIQKFRNPASFKKTISSIIIAGFVGWVAGTLLIHYLELPINVVAPLCSISGVFADSILKELEELINLVSEYVKSKAKINNKDS